MLKPKQNRFKRFIMGKGFYAVLALCLIGAGTAAWLSVDKTIGALSNDGISSQQDSSSYASRPERSAADVQSSLSTADNDTGVKHKWNINDTEAVDKQENSVPIESSTSSQSQQESASSQQEQPQSSTASEQQTLSPSSQKPAFRLPISGEIFNQFSDGELVKNETLNEWRTHDGIDIRAAIGTDVMAAAQGKITAVEHNPLWGYCVEIDHGNGYVSCYCGLDENIPVKVGDKVMGGSVIGVVGESNAAELAMDAHLHFGIKYNGCWTDPVKVLNT